MILLIDNYDSFAYNLYQLLASERDDVVVIRNDEVCVEEAKKMRPTGLVISPGPGDPAKAGISCDLIRAMGPEIPVLGICLGHQCIAASFGGRIVRAPEIVHGKTSTILHREEGVFHGLPSPLSGVRYHSLVVDPGSLPPMLMVTARAADGTIMGLRHKSWNVQGVQFHPESYQTPDGPQLIRNFLARCGG